MRTVSDRDVRALARERDGEGERRRDRIARTLLTCGSSPRGYVVTFTMSVLVVAAAASCQPSLRRASAIFVLSAALGVDIPLVVASRSKECSRYAPMLSGVSIFCSSLESRRASSPFQRESERRDDAPSHGLVRVIKSSLKRPLLFLE